jgi:hypothetical protein
VARCNKERRTSQKAKRKWQKAKFRKSSPLPLGGEGGPLQQRTKNKSKGKTQMAKGKI